ncbi:MAG: mechanosensitive ion channel family protein, partial [Thermoprotei archaeon]
INYGKHMARRIDLTIGVAYKEDPDKVLDVIRRVIDEHPLILAEPEPKIFVDSLGESSVNIAVKVWVPATMWFDVRRQIVSMIKKKLEEEKIEIPFPQMVIWFKTPLELK